MRHLIFTGLLLFSLGAAKGQKENSAKENSGYYFNQFQEFLYTKPNSDSAFYYVQKLASNARHTAMLQQLIHESFAQEFLQRKIVDSSKVDSIVQRKKFAKNLLTAMVMDSIKLLSETVYPLYMWTEIKDIKGDLQALTRLTNEFIKRLLSADDIYMNSIGRYSLLIYQDISKYPELKFLAERLLAFTYSTLEKNQVRVTDSSTRMDLAKRAWYRYIFAYTNYLMSAQIGDLSKKEQYLKLAFDYSPDLIDQNQYSAYFYDMIFLFAGEQKATFKPDYLSFLAEHSTANKAKILASLRQIALLDPEYKDELERFYKNNGPVGKPFETYWANAISADAKVAPPVSLQLLDKKLFSTKQHTGKWILIDFWGTWCGPCRAEHPDMQKFYDSVILKNKNNISLLTIACRDTKETVVSYMTEKHFTFPVAISDNQIESTYAVQGYPTKILITPEGKYIMVPFGIDWVNFVRRYSNL